MQSERTTAAVRQTSASITFHGAYRVSRESHTTAAADRMNKPTESCIRAIVRHGRTQRPVDGVLFRLLQTASPPAAACCGRRRLV